MKLGITFNDLTFEDLMEIMEIVKASEGPGSSNKLAQQQQPALSESQTERDQLMSTVESYRQLLELYRQGLESERQFKKAEKDREDQRVRVEQTFKSLGEMIQEVFPPGKERMDMDAAVRLLLHTMDHGLGSKPLPRANNAKD